MAKVRTEHKESLLAQGKWAEFVVYRDTLKAEGVKSSEANRLAVLEFLGEGAAERAGESLRRTSRLKRSGGSAGASAVAKPQKKSPVLSKSAGKQDAVPAGPPSSLGELPSELLGRTASGSEIIMWVIRHMDAVDVDYSDCPDPAAWTYLNLCRSNALFKQNFMLQVGIRSLLKQDGDGSLEDVAGLRIEETIDKLLELRGVAEAADRVHDPEVAGSSPAPATSSGGV